MPQKDFANVVKMRGMSWKRFFLLISTSFYAIVGLLLIGLALTYQFDDSSLGLKMQEIVNDWTTLPFVNIQVTSDETCPGNSELVIYKAWYGTVPYCFCHREYMSEHHVGACADSKSRVNFDFDSYYCAELDALSPVLQGSFNGMRVCGDRDGSTFYKVVRPD